MVFLRLFSWAVYYVCLRPGQYRIPGAMTVTFASSSLFKRRIALSQALLSLSLLFSPSLDGYDDRHNVDAPLLNRRA